MTATPHIAFLAAHPDDHEMMLSYYMLTAARDGHNVFAYVATDGEASTLGDPAFVASHKRRQESLAGLRTLGLPKTAIHYAALPDGALNTPSQAALLISDIANFLHRQDITAAITLGPNGGDTHPDHISVHTSTLTAVSQLRSSGQNITVWGLNATGTGSLTVPAHNRLSQKLAALACHRSQFSIPNGAPDIPALYQPFLISETYDQC